MFGIYRKSPCSLKLLRIAFDNTDSVCHKQFSVLTRCNGDRTFLDDKVTNLNRIAAFERRTFIGYVKDPKDGYRSRKESSTKEHIRDGMKLLRTELNIWTEEVKEHFRNDPRIMYLPRE